MALGLKRFGELVLQHFGDQATDFTNDPIFGRGDNPQHKERYGAMVPTTNPSRSTRALCIYLDQRGRWNYDLECCSGHVGSCWNSPGDAIKAAANIAWQRP